MEALPYCRRFRRPATARCCRRLGRRPAVAVFAAPPFPRKRSL